ncbi:MAG: acyl-CoA dehydrogenase family protein [SAR324 cluster bacterium]|nr:acyl-CoA dehydrogenase family protein [SAR324 cluster bacterium]
MNINDTADQAAFRTEVREWIEKSVPPALKGLRQGIVQGPGLSQEALQPLDKALDEKGWLAPHWPKEYGGAGFDLGQLVIFTEEFDRAGVPDRHTSGLDMLAPILMRYGSDEQKEKFLTPTLRGEITWAQGYSEPQAGSDLASLALKCEVTDEGFILNGQKIWTSKAHVSDWIFVLVRTDTNVERRQDGISFLLCDLKNSPGITVRNIITIDGFHHFNETFFDNVVVPKENLVGELNKGWTVAKALLGHERFMHPTSDPYKMGRAVDNLKASAREMPAGGGVLWDDARLRQRVVSMEMDIDCMRYTRLRALSKVQKGEEPGPETMIFKMFGAELMQKIVDLHQDVMGPAGTIWEASPIEGETGETARHDTNIRAATIRGGTSEVQRNIIAKRVLGLPD